MNKLPLAVAIALSGSAALAGDYALHTFKRIQLTDKFWGEGANFGDFNKDGKMDVVAGPYWWEGPDFAKRHTYSDDSKTSKIKKPDGSEATIPGYKGALSTENEYSKNFFAFSYDFNA